MSTNETKYPFMLMQMFYDVQHFSESLGCERGPKLKEANFIYEGGQILHIEYLEHANGLSIEINKQPTGKPEEYN